MEIPNHAVTNLAARGIGTEGSPNPHYLIPKGKSMNRPRTHHRRPQKCHSRLRLESLENRACPSCTVIQDGTTLFITGDRTDNRIAIDQDAAGCHVACDGGMTMTFRDIARIAVHSNGGNDDVDVAYGTGIYQPADLLADLGAGHDRLTINWVQPPMPDRPMLFDIAAGAGDDIVTANLTPGPDDDFTFRADLGAGHNIFAGSIAPPTEAGAAGGGAWTVAVQGEKGDDDMSLMLARAGSVPQLINADLDVTFDGGAGSDQLMIVARAITFGGTLSFDLDGDDGADALNSYFQDVSFDAPYMSCLDGGNGNDRLLDGYNNVEFGAAATVHDTAGDGNDQILSSFTDMSILANTWAGNVESGAGADQVGIIIICFSAVPGASAGFDVDAGAGADATGFVVSESDVAAGASMRIDVNAGLDPDTIYFNWNGGIVAAGASVGIGVDAGGGNDVVLGHFGFDPESRGLIGIFFQGGAGRDNLTLDISGLGPVNLNVQVDGGGGFDVAHVSRIVEVVNCEEVIYF
jgi:hypothetical protein